MKSNRSQSISFYIKAIALSLIVFAFVLTKQIQSVSSDKQVLVENSGLDSNVIDE